MMAELGSETDSLPGVIAPVLRANILDRQGRTEDAASERAAVATAFGRLRERLEVEQGQDLLDAILEWVEASRPTLSSKPHKELQAALYRRITKPLPAYFRGVRLLWLGDYESAEASLRAYLGMIAETDGGSTAHELLACARRQPIAKPSEPPNRPGERSSPAGKCAPPP